LHLASDQIFLCSAQWYTSTGEAAPPEGEEAVFWEAETGILTKSASHATFTSKGNVRDLNPVFIRGNCSHMPSQLGNFGAACKYSHDFGGSENQHHATTKRDRRVEETPEEQHARHNYNSWRRLIRELPVARDLRTMHILWDGALEICWFPFLL
jgi:hypothetical protein